MFLSKTILNKFWKFEIISCSKFNLWAEWLIYLCPNGRDCQNWTERETKALWVQSLRRMLKMAKQYIPLNENTEFSLKHPTNYLLQHTWKRPESTLTEIVNSKDVSVKIKKKKNNNICVHSENCWMSWSRIRNFVMKAINLPSCFLE